MPQRAQLAPADLPRTATSLLVRPSRSSRPLLTVHRTWGRLAEICGYSNAPGRGHTPHYKSRPGPPAKDGNQSVGFAVLSLLAQAAMLARASQDNLALTRPDHDPIQAKIKVRLGRYALVVHLEPRQMP